jgi:serine/threonine-protein kinase
VSAGAWRVAHGSRFVCSVPHDRIAAVWAADTNDSRRQSIHRAFVATGRPTAETSWERVSKVLDDYMTAWSAMYLQTCEATHVRGEQSTEVLDLRMSCLNNNVDQMRALTDALMTADGTVVSSAVLAAKDLTPVNRCADIALLKSAVPLPRDERTLRDVQRLRRELAGIEAMRELGRMREALEKAVVLTPQVEKLGYQPLLGEHLEELGILQGALHMPNAERTMEKALFVAEAARDDETAAKAASILVYTVGVDLGRVADAERWAQLATAILDRMPSGTARTRAWVRSDLASVYSENGKLEQARVLEEQAIALKTEGLGAEHPDVALSLGNLSWILTDLGRPAEGIAMAERAMSILTKTADASDVVLTHAMIGKAQALRRRLYSLLVRPTEHSRLSRR